MFVLLLLLFASLSQVSVSMGIGRTSLSLALGNMAVARQMLLIFNLSYLPCSVQFVNKNYCHAKKQSFHDLLVPLFCA